MEINNELLKELCNINGVSGYENKVIRFIYKKLEQVKLDKMFIDSVGNLICYRKGRNSEKTIMISAHVDEVGFQIIKEKDKSQFLIKSLGNIKSWNAINQVVSSENTKGIIYATNEELLKSHNFENLYIQCFDEEKINVGDVFAFESEYFETEKFYVCKALDNRISCYCLLKLIEAEIPTDSDVYYVFTVQEEISMRGTRVAKSSIKPDICITVDVSPENVRSSIKVGAGIGLKISDSIGVSNTDMISMARNICEITDIQYQMEVSDCGTSELIITNELDYGCKDIGISIPCNHIHTSHSFVCKEDVIKCRKLLTEIVKRY